MTTVYLTSYATGYRTPSDFLVVRDLTVDRVNSKYQSVLTGLHYHRTMMMMCCDLMCNVCYRYVFAIRNRASCHLIDISVTLEQLHTTTKYQYKCCATTARRWVQKLVKCSLNTTSLISAWRIRCLHRMSYTFDVLTSTGLAWLAAAVPVPVPVVDLVPQQRSLTLFIIYRHRHLHWISTTLLA